MNILRVSDEKHVLDYAVPHYNTEGQQIHFYSSTIYLSDHDDAKNYVEVDRYVTYHIKLNEGDEPQVFDYKDAEARGEHLYTDTLTIDLLTDSIDNYILVDKADIENQ